MIGTTLIFFFLLTISIVVALVSYLSVCLLCIAFTRSPTTITRDQGLNNMERGLDKAIVDSYPKLLYSQAKLQKGDSIAFCCPICLADYIDTDRLRMLPDCAHVFHVKCVDPWLRMHPSCPICRKSLLPTPLAVGTTPLTARQN